MSKFKDESFLLLSSTALSVLGKKDLFCHLFPFPQYWVFCAHNTVRYISEACAFWIRLCTFLWFVMEHFLKGCTIRTHLWIFFMTKIINCIFSELPIFTFLISALLFFIFFPVEVLSCRSHFFFSLSNLDF